MSPGLAGSPSLPGDASGGSLPLWSGSGACPASARPCPQTCASGRQRGSTTSFRQHNGTHIPQDRSRCGSRQSVLRHLDLLSRTHWAIADNAARPQRAPQPYNGTPPMFVPTSTAPALGGAPGPGAPSPVTQRFTHQDRPTFYHTPHQKKAFSAHLLTLSTTLTQAPCDYTSNPATLPPCRLKPQPPTPLPTMAPPPPKPPPPTRQPGPKTPTHRPKTQKYWPPT